MKCRGIALLFACAAAITITNAGCESLLASLFPPPDIGDADATLPAGWLFTNGNRIYISDGQGGGRVFRGRGANLQDTRGCVACIFDENESPQEVMRRADELIDVWGANFVRLTLESHAEGAEPFARHYKGVVDDPEYLQNVVDIVRHMTGKGAYVVVSLWIDPSFNDMGLPTNATGEQWRELAETFAHDSNVLFGICNEPTENLDGASDAAAWDAINRTIAVIRDVETAVGAPRHMVLAQGTGWWARRLGYYIEHPIAAGGGANIAYEIHYYNPASDLDELLAGPAAKLPVIIGEFGPIKFDDGLEMTEQDCRELMDFAMANDIPYLAWTFHHNCAPNLIVNGVGEECGVGMALEPTFWGKLLKDHLARPW